MIVVDASAVIDVVLGQSNAPWVLEQLERDELTAPAHQPAEVLSAIARLERAGVLSAKESLEALDAAASLPQVLVAPDPPLVRRAFALRARLRVLDGLYVALAERLDAVLLTTDGRLARSEPPCVVLAPASDAPG